ncbi:MAG: hypothetical protein ACRD0A_20885 [Acidimicrobiales bacterium]
MISALAVVLVGCGQPDVGDRLVIGTAEGLMTLDTGTGRIVDYPPASVATPDGGIVVTATTRAGSSSIRAVDVAYDRTLWTLGVDEPLEPRLVATGGERVALGPPRAEPLPNGYPAGRNTTQIVIAGPDAPVRRFSVAGNVEPEAFSLDGTALFVVDYQPARSPTHYQVRRLDLGTGELGDVFSVDAELQRAMQGVARSQAWDPEGDRLYTLYTLDPSAHAGVGHTRHAGHGGNAFVHVLDLDEQWAHCIDLPAGFSAGSSTLGLRHPGRLLYAFDVVNGTMAEVDTADLAVTRTAELPITAPPSARATVTADDERLFVGVGRDVVVVDQESLEPIADLRTTATVVDLRPSASGDELYVVERRSVIVLDPATGEVRGRLDLELAPDARVVAPVPTIDPARLATECAC